MRTRLVTYSVALLLGLAAAQVVPPETAAPATNTEMQQAVQSIVQIPTYATPASQSKINQQMAESFGTPQFGGENFGGFGGLESYSFSPEAYLGQATGLGINGIDAANSTKNSFWGQQMKLQKQWIDSQAAIAKNQMMLFYTEEMILLQTELQATGGFMTGCNWTCVDNCALVQPDLTSRTDCMDSCKCFSFSKYMNISSQYQVQTAVSSNASAPQPTPAVSLFAATTDKAQFEAQVDKIEGDYDAQLAALNQAERLAIEALRLKLQADVAALKQAQAVAAQAAAAAIGVVAQPQAISSPVAVEPAPPVTAQTLPLALLATEAQQPLPTLAELQAEHDRLLVQLKANFTKEKQLARIAFQEKALDLEIQQQIKELNDSLAAQASYVADLPPQYKDLFTQLQQKEMETLLRKQVQNKVQKAVARVKTNTLNQIAEFQTVLDNAVTQLKCDANCVNTCAAAAPTIDTKARCLDTCLCYAAPPVVATSTITAPPTPAVVAQPAPAVITPAPVATPALTTPVVDPVPPTTVAEPVVSNPAPLPAAETAPQQVIQETTPTQAAQVLFLGEEAIVASASGVISGSLILVLTLALVTLAVAAFLHFNQDRLAKPYYKRSAFNFAKKTENNESEEYLLIK